LPTALESFISRKVEVKENWQNKDILGKIREHLNNIQGYTLNTFQQRLIDKILEMCSPVIYRNKDSHQLFAMLKKYRLSPPTEQIMHGKTARRAGKTDGITLVESLFLVFIPNLKFVHFSLYEETCKVACDTVYEWLKKWNLTEGVTKNQLEIRYVSPTGVESRLTFITSQSPNVRIYLFYFFICFFSLVFFSLVFCFLLFFVFSCFSFFRFFCLPAEIGQI